MGKSIRTLKILARREANLRRTCRRLARDLVRACAGLPHDTSGPSLDALLAVAAQLEKAGAPLPIPKRTKETP